MNWWETLLSAGVGAATALAAVWVGWRDSGRRITADKQLAADADARERWWAALMWVWDNHDRLPKASLVRLLDALNDLSQTDEQSAMLEAVMDAIFGQGGRQP